MADEKGKAAEAAAEDGKTVIRPDISNYTKSKSASGKKSMHNGDPVAVMLDQATLEETTKIAAAVCEVTQKELTEKYAHLNIGQQRMNMGNRIRGVVNKLNKEEDGKGDKWLAEVAGPIREKVDSRIAKEAEAKAKAAEKAAKEKAEKAEAEAKTKAA